MTTNSTDLRAGRSASAYRILTVVSACINAAGQPDFALSEVLIPVGGPDWDVFYDHLEEDLRERGYECPFVHFDETEAPPFLIPAVRRYLETSM
jgi:hypothetical protein